MMAEASQSSSQVPEITVFNRVASIPLVASSLDQIDIILEKNFLTRSPYHAAQAITHTAYNYSQPIQIRLAPLINRADDIVNKGLDAVESRFPYPFKAKPEEVATYVCDRANKTFDKTVKSPACGVAEGIDKKFTPIVDYFEVAVNKVGNESGTSSPSSTSSDSQYQYQRAINLSKHLKGNIYEYSSEHLKQLREQNALVQRATETANSISSLASAQISNAQTRIHALSDNMVTELQKIQHSTAQLPQTLQATYPDISKTITNLGNIVADHNLPVSEKVNRVGHEVKERVTPLLEKLTQRIGEILNIIAAKKEEAKETTQENVKHAKESAKPTQENVKHAPRSAKNVQSNASKGVQQAAKNVQGGTKNPNGPSSTQ